MSYIRETLSVISYKTIQLQCSNCNSSLNFLYITTVILFRDGSGHCPIVRLHPCTQIFVFTKILRIILKITLKSKKNSKLRIFLFLE